MPIRLLIVDKNDLSRLKLRIFLEDLPELSTIDEARSFDEALGIINSSEISVTVVRIKKGDVEALDRLHRFREECGANSRVIALVSEETADLAAALACKLQGLCSGSIGPAELHTGIANVLDNYYWVDRSIAKVLQNACSSQQQCHIVESISSGNLPQAICEQMHLSYEEFNRKLMDEIEAIRDIPAVGRPSAKQICLSCATEYSDVPVGSKCPRDGAKLVSLTNDTQIGQVLDGRFELRELIEHGGMGDVYKAWDGVTQSDAAVKFLNSDSMQDPAFGRRLIREAEVLKMLSHPNLVRFLGSGVSSHGHPYVAMHFEEGICLESVLQNEGSIPLIRAIPIFIQMCDALAHAHSLGIIHRDLTPHNVLLSQKSERETVKLIDFGLSKWIPRLEKSIHRLTRTGLLCGTPTYMSPEQCGGGAIDQRSDIYSLGCLMYETVTGVPPFIGASVVETLRMHIHETPRDIAEVDPSLPDAFCAIVRQCLSKDPLARPQSVEQIEKVLSLVELPIVKA